ncbi:MAG: Arc family DNA-binding protein [Kiritimatiellia bacterium]|jgi:plasmid stability protein
MKTITLKGIPQPVHAALKQRAKQHGRSLNKEALACLETIVAPARVNVNALLLDIRNHRASLPGRLNDRLIRMASDEGRP